MLLVVLAALGAWVLVAAGIGTIVGRALASTRVGDDSRGPAFVGAVAGDSTWSVPVRYN